MTTIRASGSPTRCSDRRSHQRFAVDAAYQVGRPGNQPRSCHLTEPGPDRTRSTLPQGGSPSLCLACLAVTWSGPVPAGRNCSPTAAVPVHLAGSPALPVGRTGAQTNLAGNQGLGAAGSLHCTRPGCLAAFAVAVEATGSHCRVAGRRRKIAVAVVVLRIVAVGRRTETWRRPGRNRTRAGQRRRHRQCRGRGRAEFGSSWSRSCV